MSNSNSSAEIFDTVDDILRHQPFGMSLKMARTQAKLSYDQVAENLLLSVEMIKAIESSKIDVLPSAAFTKGYLRNYARLLGLPEDEIVNDYLKLVPHSKVELVTPPTEPDEKKSGRDQIIKFVVFSTIITIVIITFFWLFNSNDVVEKPEPINTGKDLLIENTNEAGSTVNEGEKGDDLGSSKPINSGTVVNTTDKPAVDATRKQVATSALATSPEGTALQPPLVTLVLTASDDSWCEIKDATGKRLCYRLLTKGAVKTMTGVPPINVFLGNAQVVDITLNGNTVEHNAFIPKYSKALRVDIFKDGAMKIAPKRKK